jgi:uncharacterized protein YkwD
LLPIVLTLSGCGGPNPAGSAGDGPELTQQEAERYVLELINRARADNGLGELSWDPVAARAGQRHAADMASRGFTAHWGSDGSVPEQRYSEAGGRHLVRENAACFFDGQARELEANARYASAELEKIHFAFLSEQPPEDGHRKNLLDPAQERVGIGLARPRGLRQPCMAQELVSDFGEFAELPAEVPPHTGVRVAGEIREPTAFGGVGVKRLPSPEPLSPEQLNRTSNYPVPAPDLVYFAPGFKTPVPVTVEGRRFEIEVPLGEPGLYQISVWGRFPDKAEELRMVSLRTLRVR